MSDHLYDDHILRHYGAPYHRGLLPNPTIAHEDENPLCGDRVHLELLLDENQRVSEVWFDGEGCAISQAAASILASYIEGVAIAELNTFQPSQMLELLRVRLSPTRQNCGLLAFKVLQAMLRTLEGCPPADE